MTTTTTTTQIGKLKTAWSMQLVVSKDEHGNVAQFAIEGEVTASEACIVLRDLIAHIIENGTDGART